MRTVLIDSISAEVHPWYWQFYLRRGRAGWASDQVSPHGYKAHLECIDGFVYVGTWTYGSSTSVTLELHDSEPTPAPADHAVEVNLDGEGQLALVNWDPDEAPVARIDLPSGRMALRGSWTGLQAVEEFPEREVAGNRPSPEAILFQIWPSVERGAKVLRSWPSEDS
jgi:hypothetical protein